MDGKKTQKKTANRDHLHLWAHNFLSGNYSSTLRNYNSSFRSGWLIFDPYHLPPNSWENISSFRRSWNCLFRDLEPFLSLTCRLYLLLCLFLSNSMRGLFVTDRNQSSYSILIPSSPWESSQAFWFLALWSTFQRYCKHDFGILVSALEPKTIYSAYLTFNFISLNSKCEFVPFKI